MLQAGDTLAGYRIEAVAGVGGMGVVYRATQLSLDRPVALKVLSSTLVGNRTFRERFRREGRHAAALDHPNIIPVYEAGESNGLMFIAMRLVDGPSLADLIGSNEISGRESLRIVGAIASALDAAHDAGLVHRDIKPQNILLTKTGHPYLADFGITKGSGHGGLTHSGDFVGSLNYVAPEQIDGKEVTGASDIYSLTAVLFQCLSGVYPYERESDAALMHAHLQAPPPTFSERGIDAPPGLDGVFERGMAKDPDQRYPTASALVDACRESLATVDPEMMRSAAAFPSPDADPASARSRPRSEPTEPDQLHVAPSPVAERSSRTAADMQRTPAATGERPAARRAIPPQVLAIAAAVLVVAAPVLGYLLGHTSPPPKPQQASTAALTLAHDATWKPAAGSIEGLKLTQALTLRRADGVKLAAGRLASNEPGFDPLPRALRARFAAKAKTTPVTVRLGSYTAVRHAVALRSGDRLWLALVPDSKGWVAIACEGPGADDPAICPAVASTLVLDGATGVPLGPDKGVAAQIDAVLTRLSAARTAARTGLKAKSAAARATAATIAADAHKQAARKLRSLDLRPQERPLVVAVATALSAEQHDLERLAKAAKHRDVARYDAARATIRRSERRVSAALRGLRAIGYGVR